MRKNKKVNHPQLPLELPEPQAKKLAICYTKSAHAERPNASVYSLADKKAEKKESETNRHIVAILKLVRHFK
ncbi:MAG: hypothetical protein KGJ66_12895 [Alphaproteobacteria bacterium]|nr:hypothetical protein [Alphaproteobacteria bacterium]